MYGRNVGKRTLHFGHEGKLYKRSFIMYDRNTHTQWVHTTGVAIKGPLRGTELEFLPSEVIPWRFWKARHPQTLVLDDGGKDTGFMGQFTLPENTTEFGLSVGTGQRVVLYPMGELMEKGILQDLDHVVTYDNKTQTARAYLADGRTFEMHESGTLRDQDGVFWDAVTGLAFESQGQGLARVPATAWLTERWHGFFPEGRVYPQ